MKKKVLAGILAATMAFSMAACGRQDPVLIPVPPQLPEAQQRQRKKASRTL